MQLLLDTHTLLWWLADDPILRPEAKTAIADAESRVALSAVVVWEIGLKKSIGKLRAPDDLGERISANRFDPLPVTLEHAYRVGDLPPLHRDPFDRMLVAQAQLEGLTIVTRDPRIAAYGVPTITA